MKRKNDRLRDIAGWSRYTRQAVTYGIFSSAGNLIAWCDSQDAALTALRDLVNEEHEAADEVAAIPVTETGRPCGEAILAGTGE